MKKTKAIIMSILVALAIVGSAILFWNYYWSTQLPQTRAVDSTEGLFHLYAQNNGGTAWTYTVSAQLPTPCDNATVDALVAESYPEQVTIRVTRSKIGDICAQVIKEFSYSGSFNASSEATVHLSVVN